MPKPSDGAHLGLERERRVVQRQLLQRLAKLLVVLRHEREQPGEHSGLDLLETRQRRYVRHARIDDRVADRRGIDLANRRDQETRLRRL